MSNPEVIAKQNQIKEAQHENDSIEKTKAISQNLFIMYKIPATIGKIAMKRKIKARIIRIAPGVPTENTK